ncbi:PREDICTED: pleckstrin homology domain-containing family M member 2 [Gekko japonicus]|uniref:Pleckstrin homology domain-containing family M member 2 n=1 Tax=Gekko japonicus TaxID=146911 RepID=A0ABM1K2X4_GEKJA|nr:PREDICTED: pleckstrin homology domain-containing family M member 2 [Gekko japonicus]
MWEGSAMLLEGEAREPSKGRCPSTLWQVRLLAQGGPAEVPCCSSSQASSRLTCSLQSRLRDGLPYGPVCSRSGPEKGAGKPQKGALSVETPQTLRAEKPPDQQEGEKRQRSPVPFPPAELLSRIQVDLQSYFAACEDETPAIRNHDKVLQRLCEHIDHALLYGLQDLPSGYWVLVVHFTRREAIEQIQLLQHVATNLGRSRAWLYLALNENSLESYLRLFQENLSLLHKYYVKSALVCSQDHLTLFLTLVSGLEFIRFDLDLDAPYLDLAPYMPDYYKPQYLLDFEDRLPCSVHGSDSLSLNSFNSVTSTNLEWDDSAIAPSSEDYDFGDVFPAVPSSLPTAAWEDGDLTDTLSGPPKSPTQRYNPFNKKAEAPSSAETTPVHHLASQERAGPVTEGADQSGSCPELEVIRLAKKKKAGKKKKGGRAEEAAAVANVAPPAAAAADPAGGAPGAGGEGGGSLVPEEPPALGQLGLRIPELKDTSMEQVGQPLSHVIDTLDRQLDPRGWGCSLEPPDQSFRTEAPEGALAEGPPSGGFRQGVPSPMVFYHFAGEGPDALAPGGGHHDSSRDGQPPPVPGGPAAAGPEEEEGGGGGGSGKGETLGPVTDSQQEEEEVAAASMEALGRLEEEEEKASPSPSSAEEDSGVEEGQGSPSEAAHPSEFRVDNNHLLLLMIHVFRENEEQLLRMIRMSTGHMEGNLQLVYVLLTDCYIYLLRKGAAEKPYMVEEALSYSELDYISVGLDQQTVTLVCTNRRKQFLLDSADAALTEFFLMSLKSAMIKGCREPPYPSILTDATMEKLALAKFVAQESKRETSEVTVRFYGLVHWEDPLDETLGPSPPHFSLAESSATKEGMLDYKAGTNYLGKELWKPCFVVLSGEQCGGCRRSNATDRPHSFQVILTERPSLELSAESEEEMAGWMQLLCQAVSRGVVPPGVAPTPCVPCCLVLTEQKLSTCHEDCQTSFFRSLATAELADVASVSVETGHGEYCILEFAQDCQQFLPPWVLYFSCPAERERFLSALDAVWRSTYQVDLLHKTIEDVGIRKKCEDALSLIRSTWQRSDSLCRGRASRDPWC